MPYRTYGMYDVESVSSHNPHSTVTAYIILCTYRGALYFSAIFAEVKQFLYFLTVTTTEHNKIYFVNTFKPLLHLKLFDPNEGFLMYETSTMFVCDNSNSLKTSMYHFLPNSFISLMYVKIFFSHSTQ